MTFSLLKSLAKLHIITPRGLFRLVCCFMSEGITLMALLRFSSIYYSNNCALVFENKRLTYKEMYNQAKLLSVIFVEKFGVKPHQNIAFICRNNIVSSLSIIALSRLGANIKLLNTDIPASKMQGLLSKHCIDLLIYDDDIAERCLPKEVNCQKVSTHDLSRLPSLTPLRMRVFHGGTISVLSGGTSGNYTEASRKSSITQFLPPLIALIKDIHIQDYDSVLITLPFYHGFGLATFIISLVMGKKMYMTRYFDATQSLSMIKEEHIQVLPLVPALLSRLYQAENGFKCLQSVKCIICGGDKLEKKQIEMTSHHLGTILFNLYGTSEAGFFMLATPYDLSRYDEVTIGKPIKFANCVLRNKDNNGNGELWVKSAWAMTSSKNHWQDTGDIVFRNTEGYYFYRGRTDKMIVCAGENVYSENVEKVLNLHPDILNSYVFPVSDTNFGTVLHAKIELSPTSSLSVEDIKTYLRPRLSRAEMPHHIEFASICLSSIGKQQTTAL